MRIAAALVAAASLTVLAAAQEPKIPAPGASVFHDPTRDAALARASAPFQAFLTANGGVWTTRWNYATGTPKAIFGDGLRLPGYRNRGVDGARDAALAVLRDHGDLLGLGTSTFRETIAARIGNSWSFTFEQHFRGLPVIGGRADVRIHDRGVVSMFGSAAWPVPANFAVVPAIDEANAARLAQLVLEGGALPPGPRVEPAAKPAPNRLVIWGDVDAAGQAPFFLAWEVPVSALDANGNGPIGRYYVDAQTGAVLHFTSDKHSCGGHAHDPERPDCCPHGGGEPAARPPTLTTITVMGWTRTGLSATSALQNVPLVGLEVSVPGVGVMVTDQYGQVTPDITSATGITLNLNGVHNRLIQGSSAPSSSITLQPGTPQTVQFLASNSGAAAAAHTTTYYWVHAANEFCRGILGNTSQLITASNILPTVNIAQTCNAYYSANTINFYAAGGGCNNAAFSTVIVHEWGHGLDERYGGISQTQGLSEGWGDIIAMYLVDDPVIGLGFAGSGGLRTGWNSTTYPPPSEVHAAGEVWMGFAWHARANLIASQGQTQGASIANTVVIGSIAANASDQPAAVLEVFLADDDDGNLNNGVPHYAELSAAATTKNLPFPPRVVGVLAHDELASADASLTPRLVLATATPTSGSFTQVRLHYDDGQARVRPMVPTGTPDQYQALLPGVAAPFAMSYHIEADHSSGATVRLPENGEFRNRIGGPDVVLYSEDFEGTVSGWTHGQTATQDDWQLGTPQGRSGTNWSDPGSANSSNVYGNDLGASSFNGAYANNVANWLRSPTVNCSGQTGVRLRFRRWLSVESGQYDQATIHVNGTQVWVNPTLTDLADSGWTQIDLPIPLADNNPAVAIEWRMTSDASVTFGGWSIDDVEIVAAGPSSPLDAELSILPDQAPGGSTETLTVRTNGAQAFVLAIGDTAGPTYIAGVPTLALGGNTFAVGAATDASGLFTLSFTAPTVSALAGVVFYSQVVVLGSTLTASNPFVNLIH